MTATPWKVVFEAVWPIFETPVSTLPDRILFLASTFIGNSFALLIRPMWALRMLIGCCRGMCWLASVASTFRLFCLAVYGLICLEGRVDGCEGAWTLLLGWLTYMVVSAFVTDAKFILIWSVLVGLTSITTLALSCVCSTWFDVGLYRSMAELCTLRYLNRPWSSMTCYTEAVLDRCCTVVAAWSFEDCTCEIICPPWLLSCADLIIFYMLCLLRVRGWNYASLVCRTGWNS